MGKIDELRNIVAKMFENANEKEQIENLAKINNSIDEVEQENKALTDKNAELIKSYKELIKHTSFKEEPKLDTPSAGNLPSLEEALGTFLAENKETN